MSHLSPRMNYIKDDRRHCRRRRQCSNHAEWIRISPFERSGQITETVRTVPASFFVQSFSVISVASIMDQKRSADLQTDLATGLYGTMVIAIMLSASAIGVVKRPRLLPQRSFPDYAYLPGRQPHPVRDPAGHSYHVGPLPLAAKASLDSDAFAWGEDLFNHGYYWEAHEAWEGLWQVAERGSAMRMLLKGLILVSAAGVKIREGKHDATVRHAGRAAALFRRLMIGPRHPFARALGMSPAVLAEHVEIAARTPAVLASTMPGQPEPVFDFILGPKARARGQAHL
ncbi:DUF309 domain-containing protein (plasmid) [Rhizobium sullae]|uniref:DUF309 domain-containing protein n=3 Tax=Rhizobium sullae TaxID=50338 RepID=A0ABY5XRQ3_RHISU|nr:DUF309 domain-containing protein [Rhizobium sullae]UWU17312.1 DUF309 domain-containing protein [Rhizobium sullae]